MPAVNGFVGISGLFGLKFSRRKVLSIAGQIVYYAILNSLLSILLCRLGVLDEWRISIGNAWYGVCYLALVFFSPLINAGIDGLANGTAKTRTAAAVLCFVPFLVDYFSRCIGLGFTVGGFGSHTFITLLYVYLFARLWFAKVWNFNRHVLGFCYFVYLLVFLVWHLCKQESGVYRSVTQWEWYNCPLVVAGGVAFVEWFRRLQPGIWLKKASSAIVPSVFAIYLIHSVSSVGWHFASKLVVNTVDICGNKNMVSTWSLCLLTSALIFASSLIVDCVFRRWPLSLARNMISRYRRNA